MMNRQLVTNQSCTPHLTDIMPPTKKQKTEEWKPLPPDEKHRPGQPGKLSEGFPEQYRDIIKNSEKRSFWKFAFHLQELVLLYRELGDHDKGDGFLKALHNMLDLSNHNSDYEKKDIGIGQEDMGTDMVKDDVKCLRDIHCVGASTVKLIEEWIETGTMKRLEDLRKEATPSITERVRYTLNGEEFEAKHDYNPDFLEALGELADLYEKEDGDHRATSFRRAITALEGQIITGVEDIEMFKLAELKGVGKATLEMYNEFIVTGKIKRLEELRPEVWTETGQPVDKDDIEWFSSLHPAQARYLRTQWDEGGSIDVEEVANCFKRDKEHYEKERSARTGIPYTFEHDGKEYKVDGDVEEDEYGGTVRGLTFDGNAYLNGKWVASVSITKYFDGDDENGCSIGVDDDGDKELEEDRDFKEACSDWFEPKNPETRDGSYRFAYRE